MVLDADVIIHFAKGGYLSMLPTIFKDFEYVVLDTVYNELKGKIKHQLDNQVIFMKNIKLIEFNPTGEVMYEYFRLLESKGVGESACVKKELITNEEAEQFISDVISQGSILPKVDFVTYIPSTLL